ncbi:MAG: host specificity factor TipJ family phage tail protein [Melioribacteraceae bacterium]
MDSIVTQNKVSVIACKNPLTMQKTDYVFCEGLTIAQMLEVVNIPYYVSVLVSIDGVPAPADQYKHIIPAKGSLVTMRTVPTGGGGSKSPLRTILTIVVIALATITQQHWVTAGYIGGAAGAYVAAGVVMTVGMLIVNAIAPPPIPSSLSGSQQTYKDSPSYALSGARNTISPYGVIPMLLGRHRITPPYGALPYTENLGDDQFLRCLFCNGYGRLVYSDHKLGETPIASFSDVEIETRDGSDSTNTSLYPGDVFQQDLAVTLVQSESWSVRTTQPDTTRISVDVTYPRGLVSFNDDGSRATVTSQLEFQYAVKDSGVWHGSVSGVSFVSRNISGSYYTDPLQERKDILIMDKISGTLSIISGQVGYPGSYWPALSPTIPSWAEGLASWDVGESAISAFTDIRKTSFVTAGYFVPSHISGLAFSVGAGVLVSDFFNISGATTSIIRRTLSIPVSAGQYDVRMRRVSADTSSDRILDDVQWTALRSFQTGSPILEQNMARTALRIRATDQLNGAIDNYNCIAQLICPDYDVTTDTWITRPTSNPASLYRYVLQGPANKRPLVDSEVDLDILAEWHGVCESNGFSFNHYFDYRTSVDAVLQMVAAAGRAAPGYVDGKYAVVMDRIQSNIAQHFTPRNSWGYSYNKAFLDRPHAFRVKFWNKDADWREDERIVYDDGYSEANATLFEEMSLPGINTSALAWKHGRYHIATARLRPERHTFNSDFEYLTCTRGDRIKFTNDVISVGLGYGRVKSYTDDGTNVTTVTVDEELSMESGKTYQFRIRQHDGDSLEIPLVTSVGTSDTFTVNMTLPIANAPDIGAIMMYGETESESIDLIVKDISPQSDYTAQLTCLSYAPEVHSSDTGTIPSFSTNITIPVDRASVYIPQFTLRSDESTLIIIGNTFVPRIVATFQSQVVPPGLIDSIEVQYRLKGTQNPCISVFSINNDISLEDEIFQGKTYTIQARYHIDGKAGLWSPCQTHTVVGLSTNPSDVENFNVNILGQTAYLSWDAVTDSDLSHYIIKFSTAVAGATWGSSVSLVEKIGKPNTSISVPAMTGSYLIKAVDFSTPAIESINATVISTTVPGLENLNVVSTLTEHSSFLGTKTNCEVVGSNLRLSSVDTLSDWTTLSSVRNLYFGVNGINTSGMYEFYNSQDLGDVYSSRLSATMLVSGNNIANFMSGWLALSSVESLSGTDPSMWAAYLELRTTNDDPSATPTWSGWQPFIVGDYLARAYEFRLNLISTSSSITPDVSSLSVRIDMPDRVYGDDDVVCLNTGLSVLFSPAFKEKPAIAVSGQNMGTGDYYVISNQSASGFDITFYNSSAVGIEKTFDFVAKGFGYVN